MTNPVVIVEYDPQWPTLYEKEKKLIRKALEHRISGVEHIGSTSVPNLGGKNIIDVMAGTRGPEEADQCLSPLEGIGYKSVTPEPDNPEWYYCLGKGQHSVGYHLHLVKYSSAHWKKHTIFRDFLRGNRQVAQEYYNLKKKLAERYGADRVGYTEAKSAFIESVLAKASQSTRR
jgi:GrpB-like predicted nucleotidyltransferase (UPF0157 family)